MAQIKIEHRQRFSTGAGIETSEIQDSTKISTVSSRAIPTIHSKPLDLDQRHRSDGFPSPFLKHPARTDHDDVAALF